MTREEAIRILDGLKPNTAIAYGNETAYSIGQALTMAIKALEQEPSGDAIRRQAVLNTLDRMDKALDTDRTVESYKELLTECYKALPPVNSTKTGHWIKSNIPNEKYVCSECGGGGWYYDYQADVAKSRYCPNCGCAMKGELE